MIVVAIIVVSKRLIPFFVFAYDNVIFIGFEIILIGRFVCYIVDQRGHRSFLIDHGEKFDVADVVDDQL